MVHIIAMLPVKSKKANKTNLFVRFLGIYGAEICFWSYLTFSISHFKVLGMRNLQYEMRIGQKVHSKVTITI